MIHYALNCDKGHGFESWFQSAAAFDALNAAAMIACPDCGSTRVAKALMAPQVRPSRDDEGAAANALSAPANPREQALAELRRKIETESEYVGMNFVAEARAMHEGEAPERSIHGEARIDEARALLEEGVPVAPLPFIPARKTN
jgi:hypothetical protein